MLSTAAPGCRGVCHHLGAQSFCGGVPAGPLQELIPKAKDGPMDNLFKGPKSPFKGFAGGASGVQNGDGFRDPYIQLDDAHRECGLGWLAALGRRGGGADPVACALYNGYLFRPCASTNFRLD